MLMMEQRWISRLIANLRVRFWLLPVVRDCTGGVDPVMRVAKLGELQLQQGEQSPGGGLRP